MENSVCLIGCLCLLTLNVPFKIRKAERVFMNVGSLPIRCFFVMVSNTSLFCVQEFEILVV